LEAILVVGHAKLNKHVGVHDKPQADPGKVKEPFEDKVVVHIALRDEEKCIYFDQDAYRDPSSPERLEHG